MADNSINLPNYNIDYFQSINLGPITDTSFRTHLFTHNLPVPNDVISGLLSDPWADRATEYDVSQSGTYVIDIPKLETVAQEPSVYNNFTNPRAVNLEKNATASDFENWYDYFGVINSSYGSDYNTPYGVPETLRIGYVGNVDGWNIGNGIVTTTHDVRDVTLLSKINNKYGPQQIVNYSVGGDELVDGSTGFIQYSDFVAGDFRDQLLSRTLGIGVVPFSTEGSGINFLPDGQNISELDKIARQRRGQEVANRIKLNFVDNTVGSINTSPFTLLAGGNIIEQDFKITRPASFLGKAAEFISNLAGFTLPRSILTDGDLSYFTYYPGKASKPLNSPSPQNKNEVDIQSGLLDRTGKPTRDVLLDTVNINKYGPVFNGDYSDLNQGTYVNTTTETDKNGPIPNTNLNFDPAIPNGMSQGGGFYGKFEPYESVNRVFSEEAGFGQENGINEALDYNKDSTTYQGTPVENFNVTPDQTGTVNEKLDWRKRNSNPFSKGILKYTQNIINNSKLTDPGGYIGYFDSGEAFGKEEYKQSTDKHGHLTGTENPTSKPTRESRGNTTRNVSINTSTRKLQDGAYYSRSWSSRRKYHTYSNLVRNDVNWWRNNDKNSNMTMNWDANHEGGKTNTPKIAWDQGDTNFSKIQRIDTKIKGMVIPYMLSIENLAWKDAPQILKLPESEIGPNGGRIMWFPPYDISFSESNSVNWDTTSFIGRGENIYTYNNSERSGTLDFTIIVDHPTVLNQLKRNFADVLNDDLLHSFFAGADNETLKQYFKNFIPAEIMDQTTAIDQYLDSLDPAVPKITPKDPDSPPAVKEIFFEDGESTVDVTNYEVTTPSTKYINTNQWNTDAVNYPCGPASANTYSYLNKDVQSNLQKLAEFLITEDGKNYKIVIDGYSYGTDGLTNGTAIDNNQLQTVANSRAESVRSYIYNLMNSIESDPPHLMGKKDYPQYPKESELIGSQDRWSVKGTPITIGATNIQTGTLPINPGNPCTEPSDAGTIDGIPASAFPNSREAKSYRYVKITLEKNQNIQVKLLSDQTGQEKWTGKSKSQQNYQDLINAERENILRNTSNFFVTEQEYFEKIKQDAPFIYNSLTEKIKYFHPAFHSMTPEGLNSRLTFLTQCTRQGPQLIDQNAPQNMVFGRPPICVLRIGDFYNTKIVVDSININYDPLQWDLNPEGIGVQPMLAKVSMSFKFIGGSSLGGPISQLQNAVSYNFFANTSVYNPASTFSLTGEKLKYIYGAFSSPEDATSKINEVTSSMVEVQKQTQKDKKETVNTPEENTKTAETDQNTQTQIEDNSPTDTTTGTDGETNFPTPPVPPDLERMKASGYYQPGGILFFTLSISNVQIEDNFNTFQDIPPDTPGYQQLIISGKQLYRDESLSKNYTIIGISINNGQTIEVSQPVDKDSIVVNGQLFIQITNLGQQNSIKLILDTGDTISGPLSVN